MIIYCDGDSYIAGTELGDDILPEYPGCLPIYHSKKDLVNNRRWLDRTNDNGDLSQIRNQLREKIGFLEKERAFPKKIAKKLNIEVVNAALGGSSMDAICRRTLSNLIKLKDKDNVVAVVGISDPWRFELPNSNNDTVPWICIHPFSSGDHIKDVMKYMVSTSKFYHSMVKFYKNVITIQDFCKLNNIRLIFIDRNLIRLAETQIKIVETQFENCEDYINLKNYSNFKANLNISLSDLGCTFKTESILCPSYHYAEIVHEYIADEIIKLL